MRIYVSILVSLFSIAMWGQWENRDSLIQLSIELDSLAEYNSEQGNDSVAITFCTKSIDIRRNVLGTDNPDYAKSLSHLANYNNELGFYDEAIDYISKAINIYKKTQNTNNADFARSLMILAEIKDNIGEIQHAIQLGKESLNIIQNIYGENSVQYAYFIGCLAPLYFDLGDVIESSKLNEKAVSILEMLKQTQNNEYASALVNLSKCKCQLGNYTDAIRYVSSAAIIFRQLYGVSHPSYAVSLSCLATYNSYMGNHREAIHLQSEALSLLKLHYGASSLSCIISMTNIATYHYYINEFEECLKRANAVKEICEYSIGKENSYYCNLLDLQSRCYWELHNYEKALIIARESLDLRKDIQGINHPDYALTLCNVALYSSELGFYLDAYKYGKEALEIWKKNWGERNIQYCNLMQALSTFCYDIAKYEESVAYERKALELYIEEVARLFSLMNGNKRLAFWGLVKERFYDYLGLAFRLPNLIDISDVYDKVALFAKGILLATERRIKEHILEDGDSVLINKYNKLLENISVYGSQLTMPNAERSIDTDSLNQIIIEQEKEIANVSETYKELKRNLTVNWNNVKKTLCYNDIAIEFLSFPIQNDSVIYIALTLRKDSEEPKMTVLFEEKQLKEVSDTLYYLCREMTDLVWKPLESELSGIKNIYFSPSGALYNIGIEYLPGMEDYNIYRLSSTRELVTGKKSNAKKSAVLYGGLKYDTKLDSLSKAKSRALLDDTFIDHVDMRGMGLRGGKEYLKHTKIEVDKIGEELKNANWVCMLDTATLGTEESFKALSGKRIGCLHISTHGFYYTKEEADNARYQFMLLDDDMVSAEDKALTRSGLILSGANHILEGKIIPENVEDGILTAKEIADMDLHELDLVVLSACQTGLGDISQGEGVFGLQRGFKKAGANSILMSLWKVDDEATQILMTQFYKHLVAGQSKRQSLQAAQKYLREYNNGYYNEPKYWAAFILLDAKE